MHLFPVVKSTDSSQSTKNCRQIPVEIWIIITYLLNFLSSNHNYLLLHLNPIKFNGVSITFVSLINSLTIALDLERSSHFRVVKPICILCRSLEDSLETSGVRLSTFTYIPPEDIIHPCSRLCLLDFNSGKRCSHGIYFCSKCEENYTENDLGECEEHKKVLKENSDNFHNMFSSKIGFYSLHPYNHFDVQCDFECEYLAEKNISSICRHALSRCENCKRCWDGFAQRPCLFQSFECDDEINKHGESISSSSSKRRRIQNW